MMSLVIVIRALKYVEPLKFVFWGGNGSGAAGNAVVNATGDLLGIDIILPGNYSEEPFNKSSR